MLLYRVEMIRMCSVSVTEYCVRAERRYFEWSRGAKSQIGTKKKRGYQHTADC
tara:strand:+ start:517 stop:675 length:159 start_codon:yes stop_codon:yes gene_type:complete